MFSSTANDERQVHLATWLRQMEQLASDAQSEPEFFGKFVPLIVSATRATAAALFTIGEGKRLQLMAEENFRTLGIAGHPEKLKLNTELLAAGIGAGQIQGIGPEELDRPTQHFIVTVPIFDQSTCKGILELFYSEPETVEDRLELLQQIEQLSSHSATFYSQADDQFLSLESPHFWQEFEPFLLELHSGLSIRQKAMSAANDVRRILDVDRVTIGITQGRRIKIRAVSGQDSVNSRANLVRHLRRLSETVIRTGKPFVHDGKSLEMAPQVEKRLGDYLNESATRLLVIMPLYARQPEKPKRDNEPKPKDRRKPCGVLIIERLTSHQFSEARMEVAKLVADHLGTAIGNARRHEELFLLPLWRAIGHFFAWLHGSRIWKAAAIVAGIVAVILAMIYVPWDYRVEGNGRLMPIIQREAFVPWDGEVAKVFVKGGQQVKKGDKLVQLKNEDLEAEWLRVEGDLQEKTQLLVSLRAEHRAALNRGDQEEAVRVEGRFAETETDVRSLALQEKVLRTRVEKLLVKAPIDGVVATFQVEQLLRYRPVQRGEVLMEVMDPTGDWHLELDVDDKRIGHILREQEVRQTEQLPVEFILATDPELAFDGHVAKMATRTDSLQDAGNVVQVFVDPEVDELPYHLIGAEVKAKINCGQKPLGYVLLGDVIDFIRIRLWF